MATGFMSGPFVKRLRWRHCSVASALLCSVVGAGAQQVGLAGLLPGKAMLVIDGSPMRAVSVGQRTAEGVKLIAVENASAVVEVAGQRQTLRLGQNASGAANAPVTVVLNAESGGHFRSVGSINGVPVNFLVDTGATTVSIGAADARRIGINTVGGERMYTQTANGIAPVRQVRLDNVRVGSISLNGVEAQVLETDMPMVLLGMSFLNRTDMQREGNTLTLKKRY